MRGPCPGDPLGHTASYTRCIPVLSLALMCSSARATDYANLPLTIKTRLLIGVHRQARKRDRLKRKIKFKKSSSELLSR